MIKDIDLSIYNEFHDLSMRFFELHPKDEMKLKIFSAKLNIDFGIQDINNLIHKINKQKGDIDSSWFYELIVKGFQVFGAVHIIMKKYDVLNNSYDEIYGKENKDDNLERTKDRQKIDFFLALRTLTAHPLERDVKYFDKFNIKKRTFLEDIRPKKAYRAFNPDIKGDFILKLRKKDDNSYDNLGIEEQIEVSIDKDIIEPLSIIVSKLSKVNEKIERLIKKKENKLKHKPIGDLKKVDDIFLTNLKEAVLERYPKQIEVIKYENDETEEYWEIQELFDFVTWEPNFDNDRNLKVKELQEIKRSELLQYAEKVQNMMLKVEDYYTLSSNINSDGIDYYSQSKVQAYLKSRNNSPDLKELEYWFKDLSAASLPNAVSNELWGALQLKKIQSQLDTFFQFDWNTSYQELYWQYLVALFVRQQDSISLEE